MVYLVDYVMIVHVAEASAQLKADYYGAQNDYTHIFDYLSISFPVAQDICYTGFSGRNSFV